MNRQSTARPLDSTSDHLFILGLVLLILRSFGHNLHLLLSSFYSSFTFCLLPFEPAVIISWPFLTLRGSGSPTFDFTLDYKNSGLEPLWPFIPDLLESKSFSFGDLITRELLFQLFSVFLLLSCVY